MPSQEAAAAFRKRLADNWTLCPFIGPDETTRSPSDGSAFLEYEFPTQGAAHVGLGGIGERTFRDDGTLRLVLNVPKGTAIDTGLGWAKTLRDLFVGISFDGVTTFTPSSPRIDSGNIAGKYFRLSVIVHYTFDWTA